MRLFLLLFLTSFLSSAQLTLTTLNLPKSVQETSGLEFFGDYLITHNDSGDDPKLYFLTQEGKKVMEIKLNQLKNKDWEDITADEDHYYIADTGNNFATRENLKIYILNRDFIPEGSLSIRYEAQTTFSREPLNEFDAEALAAVGEHLVLFSKNRKTLQSELYVIPKTSGDYVLTPRTSITTQALITAADYNKTHDLMVLTGYDFRGDQFFYKLTNFTKRGFENIQLKRYSIPVKPAQIEAVKIIDATHFWMTSESEEKKTPRLFLATLESE